MVIVKVYIAEILIIPEESDSKDGICEGLEETLINGGFMIGNVTLKEAEVVLCED